MDAYAVYSHCVAIPDLVVVADDATLAQQQQDLLNRHPALVGVELTSTLGSERQLMVALSGPTHAVLKAKSEVLASDTIQVMEKQKMNTKNKERACTFG